MNRLNLEELYLCSLLDIEVALLTVDDIENFKKYPLKVQIEINSGMNRFGIEVKDIFKVDGLNIVGIYSHNATLSKKNIKKQLKIFLSILPYKEQIDIHYQSSSLFYEKIDYVNSKRVGEFLYNDSLSLYGKIININFCKKGTFVGYNYTYKLKKDSLVAVVDIGYNDGFYRDCNGFKVYINGKSYKVIGLSCMNHCFVLVDNLVKINNVVEFISINNNILYYCNFFHKVKHQIYLDILKKFTN